MQSPSPGLFFQEKDLHMHEKTIVLPTGQQLQRIDEFYAFVASDETGEGLTGFQVPGSGMMLPMVCADKERVDSLREIAKDIAKNSNRPVRLLKFSVREELEIFEP